MKNVITLGKLIHPLLFCLPFLLLSISVHTNNTRNELARLVMGCIFLVIGERAKHRSVQSRMRNIYVYILYVCCFCPLTLSGSRKEGGASF